jgi:hypothetical protein
MTDDPHASLDRRLRDAFDGDPGRASRAAAAAFAGDGTRRRRGWRRAAAVVCPVAVLVGLAFAMTRWTSPSVPHPEPAFVSLSGSLTDGLLVVALPDGSTSITGGESREDRPLDGYGIVLVEGELR